MDNITDKRIDEHYLQSNPYENYGKKVLAECESCSTELIGSDEVYILDGFIYCSKECMLHEHIFEKVILCNFLRKEV